MSTEEEETDLVPAENGNTTSSTTNQHLHSPLRKTPYPKQKFAPSVRTNEKGETLHSRQPEQVVVQFRNGYRFAETTDNLPPTWEAPEVVRYSTPRGRRTIGITTSKGAIVGADVVSGGGEQVVPKEAVLGTEQLG